MSYRASLVQFFKEQLKTPPNETDELESYPVVSLDGFLTFELRVYPGYEGFTPDGQLSVVPARAMVAVRSTPDFAKVLNEGTKPIAITLSGIDLPAAERDQLIADATKCRAELLKNEQALLGDLVDLRVMKNSSERRVLTASIPTKDEEHPAMSPLLRSIMDELQA